MPWVTKTGRNFMAKIDGTDPELKKQVIVVQSYYDSTSVVPALAPGADTTCGMAAMLEMMRYFNQAEHRPKRTMMVRRDQRALPGAAGHSRIRACTHGRVDAAQPGRSRDREGERRARQRSGWSAFLALFAILLVVRLARKLAEGEKRFDGPHDLCRASRCSSCCSSTSASSRSRTTESCATPPTIFLWAGLDLTSQTQSFGIFYKGWFFDYREDIQGRFSDIARVCRENAEKVGTTLGFNSKRYFNDGVNPVDGKNWRNFIPGKPAFDSEVVTIAGGNGITFASTDDSRSLVDTPFDTAGQGQYRQSGAAGEAARLPDVAYRDRYQRPRRRERAAHADHRSLQMVPHGASGRLRDGAGPGADVQPAQILHRQLRSRASPTPSSSSATATSRLWACAATWSSAREWTTPERMGDLPWMPTATR